MIILLKFQYGNFSEESGRTLKRFLHERLNAYAYVDRMKRERESERSRALTSA